MKARIYQPTKTAMQSGRAKTHRWLLESLPQSRKTRDPLMGWTSSDDMNRQWRLSFETRDEAVAYAERRGIAYEVEEPHERRIQPKSYAANFRWNRPPG
ncbi:MAG: ETC complex I subunit [Alphaproteobacteria bacterium]|nr:ETC complex I subunit [Alphaproteobacteria bacterium]